MAAPDFFVRSLLRYAQEQGRNALVALATGQMQLVTENGGRQLTGGGANGKSFSYSVPQKLSILDLIEKAEEALTLYDSMGAAEVALMLSTRPPSRTVSRSRGDYFGHHHLGY